MTDTNSTSGGRDVTTIPSENPSQEELKQICAEIKENFDFDVEVKPTTFHFKATKDDNGVTTKREPLELAVPYPTVSGIAKIIESGGKGLELLRDAIEKVIVARARQLISDDIELNATNFPTDQLSWEAIANLPKPERTGGGIPKEVWEEFAADYIDAMPGITGKEEEKVRNAAKLHVQKYSTIKTNKPVLRALQEQLAIYAEKAPNAEEFVACIEFLDNKIEGLLNVSEEELLEAL